MSLESSLEEHEQGRYTALGADSALELLMGPHIPTWHISPLPSAWLPTPLLSAQLAHKAPSGQASHLPIKSSQTEVNLRNEAFSRT